MGGAKSVATVLHQTTLRCSRAARGCPLARLQAAALHAFGFRFGSLRRFLMHPMVRVHFVDVTTQAYLQKTSGRSEQSPQCVSVRIATIIGTCIRLPVRPRRRIPHAAHHREVGSSDVSLVHSAAEAAGGANCCRSSTTQFESQSYILPVVPCPTSSGPSANHRAVSIHPSIHPFASPVHCRRPGHAAPWIRGFVRALVYRRLDYLPHLK
jgi:hypothetical protein